ncbi:MAG TPA: hypothetical protein PLG73_04930 [Candidatus Sumerlaeota bacterium]|nr:hypothetical protein [Candidatus Sumerlaeota bacterium]
MPASLAPTPRIRLHQADADAPWGPALLDSAERALEAAEARLGLRLDQTARIVSLGSEREFHEYLQSRPAHVVAVARSRRNEIVIHREAFFRQTPVEQQRTLVHEMVHLILGRRVRGELPGWLNEGLAMLVAGEGNYRSAWRVQVAGAFGALIPLEQLESQVAIGSELQELAYAQSLSVTRFYLERSWPESTGGPGGLNPAPLARELADPLEGPRLLTRLWDVHFRRSLEAQWRRDHRNVWTWIAFLSGSGFIWLFAGVLFLLAYWRKRRFARQKREMFAAEEERDRELSLDIPPWEYEADESDEDRGR